MYEGIERFTAGWFENLLVPVWIAALPNLRAGLQARHSRRRRGLRPRPGADQARSDLSGVTVHGYDLSVLMSIEPRRMHERQEWVTVQTFRQGDAAEGLAETYDLITTFDVVHDAVDPVGLLRTIRQALQPDGTYLCLGN